MIADEGKDFEKIINKIPETCFQEMVMLELQEMQVTRCQQKIKKKPPHAHVILRDSIIFEHLFPF